MHHQSEADDVGRARIEVTNDSRCCVGRVVVDN